MLIRTVGDAKAFLEDFDNDMPFLVSLDERDPFVTFEGCRETNVPGYPDYPMLLVRDEQ